ncbi:hypothetical protein ALC53_07123 [Atta colombica]|uniref:Uncharacterized protein n=1 Tax=Atta colombica TaxID=520822 RepID=A0A195BDS7_9HYME|nr:hypothetical protein ALC53_07123 [Atta colombica]
MSANPADKSSRVASRSHYRIRAASISKYSDNLGMALGGVGVDVVRYYVGA